MLMASRGELDPRSLWFILTDVMASVERVRRRFEKRAGGAPEQAARAREMFKRHRQVLDLACRHVTGPPPELKRLAGELRTVNQELDLCLAEHREAALVALGPTRLAGVNAVLRSVQQQRPPAALGSCLAQERKRLEQAMATPGLSEAVAEVLSQMNDHVCEMLLLTGDPTRARLHELAQSYYRVALQAQELFARAEQEAEWEKGPTPHAGLNRLIHQVRDGQPVDPTDLLGELAGMRNQLASLARMLSSTARVPEIAAGLEESFDLLERAIEGMCAQPARWPEAVRAISQAFAGLTRGGQELKSLSESEGKTPCAHCGQLNRSDFASCSRCGALLPRMAGVRQSLLDVSENATVGPPMTENLKRLVDAIGAFEAGSIGREVFQDQVVWFRGLLARALELWPAGQDPPADYLEALQDLEAGLSFLEQADGSGAVLDSGRALVLKGAARAMSR